MYLCKNKDKYEKSINVFLKFCIKIDNLCQVCTLAINIAMA